jgi:hypothetical protein
MRPSLCLLERAERRTASTPPYQYLMEAWNVTSAREAYINLLKEFVPNNLRFHSVESTTLRSYAQVPTPLRPLLLATHAEAMVAQSTLPQGRDAREDFVFIHKFSCLESLPLAFSKLWSVTGRSLGVFPTIAERDTDERKHGQAFLRHLLGTSGGAGHNGGSVRRSVSFLRWS